MKQMEKLHAWKKTQCFRFRHDFDVSNSRTRSPARMRSAHFCKTLLYWQASNHDNRLRLWKTTTSCMWNTSISTHPCSHTSIHAVHPRAHGLRGTQCAETKTSLPWLSSSILIADISGPSGRRWIQLKPLGKPILLSVLNGIWRDFPLTRQATPGGLRARRWLEWPGAQVSAGRLGKESGRKEAAARGWIWERSAAVGSFIHRDVTALHRQLLRLRSHHCNRGDVTKPRPR